MGQSPLLLETEGNQETHKLHIKYNIFLGFLGVYYVPRHFSHKELSGGFSILISAWGVSEGESLMNLNKIYFLMAFIRLSLPRQRPKSIMRGRAKG